MTEIRNINDGSFDPKNPNHVYIGRAAKYKGKWLKASPFANPFKVKKHTTAEHIEAVRKYYDFISQQPELITQIRTKLRGKTLFCWCKPLPCHGDLLVLIADSVEVGAKDIIKGMPAIIENTCDLCAKPIKEGGQPMHTKIAVGWMAESGAFCNETFDIDFTMCSNQCVVAAELLIHGLYYQMTDYNKLSQHLKESHGLTQSEIDSGLNRWEQVIEQETDEDLPRLAAKIQDASRIAFLSH